MRLSVSVEAVFEGWDFVESLKAVKAAGIGAFEFWGWWDKDLREIGKAGARLGLDVASFCTRFISLVDPGLRKAYVEGLRESVEKAGELGCDRLITQTGNELPGIPRQEQHMSLVEGLRACCPVLEAAGVTLLVEPLNTAFDHPGYYLRTSAEAFEIVDEVGSPRVKVLYDIYHQQITEGNLIPTLTAHIGKIGHFHAAGHPGRHELASGEVDYRNVAAAIRGTGYRGWFGLEYFPLGGPEKSLSEAVSLIG